MLPRIRRSILGWIVAGMAVVLAGAVFRNAYAAPAAQTCTNDAEIVEESSDPADLVLAPGQSFTKSWRIRNTGDCRWTSDYSLSLADGSHMGSGYYAQVSRRVSPNATYIATMEFMAPTIPGVYHAEWQLVDANYEEFGPPLNVDVEVTDLATDPELPDVLLLAGLGAGGGEGCWDSVPESPEPGFQLLQYGRSAGICAYYFPTGTVVTAELTSPDGETFRSEQEVGEPLIGYDETGTYTMTYTLAGFGPEWPNPYPAGEWALKVEAGGMTFEDTISVTEPEPQVVEGPDISHLPAGSIDPFRTALLCLYTYYPGDEIIIGGTGFPAATDLLFGIYHRQDDEDYGLFVDRILDRTLTTDADGAFQTTHHVPASATAGQYWVVATHDPAATTVDWDNDGFLDSGDLPGTTCFDVQAPPRELADANATLTAGLQLAYVSVSDGSGDIHLFDLDSGEGTPLATEECDETAPVWWPDGESIVYSADCRGSYDIYRIDRTGGSTRRLITSTRYDEGEPAISPDGALLVYRRTPVGELHTADGELVIRNVATRATTPLGIAGRAPAWSPDGAQIAYMAQDDRIWQVYVYTLASGETRLVSEGCPTQCGYPAWSPDGQTLAYSASRTARRFTPDAIWTVPAEGGESQLWLGGLVGQPAWSAAGLLAFTAAQGIEMVTDQDDAQPQPLVDGEELRKPAWSR